MRSPITSAPGDSSVAAIRHLTEQGYEATTAEDLANAIGVSRSTFFRRYGNKDDVVFADHDYALEHLELFLDSPETPAADTLVQAATDVLRLLVRNPEAARLRFELMRDTPALRDRELIITHRYERVFAKYLRRALPAETPGWVAASLSAGIVAVHNTTLREWLTGEVDEPARVVERDLRRLTALYDRWLSPDADTTRRRVVVAVYEADGSPESVLDAVAGQLGTLPPL